MGGPPSVVKPVAAEKPTKGIALYINNADCYRNIEATNSLYISAENVYSDLWAVSLAISESDASPEVKEVEQKQCSDHMEIVERIIHDIPNYIHVKRILLKYRAITEVFRKGRLTAERSAALSIAMSSLEQQFQHCEVLAKNMMTPDVYQHYAANVGEAESFVQIYKVPESTHLTDQEASTEWKPLGKVITWKAQETITRNTEDIKDAKKSSGHTVIRMGVIRTMVAVGIMAAL
ncbi:hypothetical protein, conserved [Babesia ovata]|uniref:Uncharacterized protein n=1 Tax=Babesia ovata TaxID=189622 RepID=A0A2H6KD93_9APIC|nr:uncharacterized protein BOVATA_024630 [Babesia ovata]GBE60970.1 hypothetical protein, conserved [Babesia ovata]